jgi:8-oxo-dGTP diphosphatase
MSFTYDYPHPSVTVDVVIFGLDMTAPPVLNVLLIKRGRQNEPYYDCWAIPGGFVNENEDLEVAARRETIEETHANPTYIEQLKTFGTPGRDPRGHVISVAYMALVRTNGMDIQADDDAKEAAWWPVDDLSNINLAFDHAEILTVALNRLRSKLRWQPIGIDLLPEVFSLPELQQVYEAILGHSIVRRTLRRRVASYGVLVPAGSRRIAGDFGGRPPDLWRFDRDAYEALLEEGGKFEL